LFNCFAIREILGTPPEFLRGKFLITSKLRFLNLQWTTLELYTRCYKEGLKTNGKVLKGLLAAVSYLCSYKIGHVHSQSQLSILFGTNEVSLRSHIPEIIKIAPEYRIIKKKKYLKWETT